MITTYLKLVFDKYATVIKIKNNNENSAILWAINISTKYTITKNSFVLGSRLWITVSSGMYLLIKNYSFTSISY